MTIGPTDQHDLFCEVLRRAGGIDVSSILPAEHRGSNADILFEDENVVFEVKSITTDRPNEDRIMHEVAELLMRDAGMIIFGQVNIDPTKLPERAARNLFRHIGRRYQAEIKASNIQIRQTKLALDRETARGAVAFIAPPSKISPEVVRWLVADAIRGGKFSCVDSLIIAQTQLCGPGWGLATLDSWLAFVDRDDREIPMGLKRRIATHWAEIHQHRPIELSSGEDFDESFPRC